ncbi:MAG TPA: ABC transporter [Lachnospiraceae bacterium]|nr:ABC transporter ATP-binding protein [uncultured Lachnoclostridium sp.]HAU87726.1 ABC transporter [Lachnospiraceae bacterium]
MIEVKNLVKKYSDHAAVDNLSFTLEKGHVLGFLGPNGAGKSTTMNIITGYLQATSGSVKVNGHDIEEEPDLVKNSIGYLPEIPPLYPDMRVKEYLTFVAELKKVKKAERKGMIQEIIQMIGLQDVENRLIQHLSKGYKQRVGLAGAIMGYPDLIILDEPTVGLDPKQVIEIRELIRKLSEKHTIILSSHILSEVSAVCDEIMIINKGKLVVRDTPENLSQSDGKTSLAIKAKGTKEQITSILNGIKGIEEVIFNEAAVTEAGVEQVTVSYKENEELRDEISFAFAAAKCPIYEMKSTTLSLEDIFLQLTGGVSEPEAQKAEEKKPEKVYENVEEAVGVSTVELTSDDNDKEGE